MAAAEEKFEFTDAVREAIPPLVAIAGPSGSGKTKTALRLATGMAKGRPVFGIDSENKRMKLYAGEHVFKHLPLSPPFHPDRFVGAIEAAVRAGAGAIIVDSGSAEWEGIGGGLDIHRKAEAAMRNPNAFTAWGKVTPLHQRFIDTLTHCPVALIVTLRSKMAYEQEGSKIKKLGLQPIQRPGFEYEFPFWISMDMNHTATVERSCWSELQDQTYVKPGEELGEALANWLDEGESEGSAPQEEWKAPAAKPFDGSDPRPSMPAPADDPDKPKRMALRKKLRNLYPNYGPVQSNAIQNMTLDELYDVEAGATS